MVSDAANAGSVYSEIRIKIDKLKSDIKKAEAQLDGLDTSSKKNASNFSKSWSGAFKNFDLAGTAAIAAVTLAFKSAISVFATTEQKLANVRSVTGATAEEFQTLETAAEEAGKTTRFTAGEAADALYSLASAGLDAEESVSALDGVLLAAGATGSDLAFTSQTITSTLAQFSLASDQAADVANIFAAATANSQANMEKLAGSLRQVGPIAGSLGISLEEVTGALQLLFNAGFQGEQAGTALRNALGDLANASSPAVTKLEALGISASSVNPEIVGLSDAIGALADAGLTTADVIEVFGKEAGPQLVTLVSAGREEIEKYTAAVTDTTAAAEQYSIQNDTLAGSIDEAKSAIEGAAISLIKELAPALEAIIDFGAGVIRFLGDLPGGLLAVIGGAGAAATAVGGVSTALGVLGVSIGAALGPITAIAAGIGAVVAVTAKLIKRSKELRAERLEEQFGSIADAAGVGAENFEEFAEAADMVEGALIRGSFDGFTDAAEQTKALAENMGLTLEAVIEIGLQSEDVTDQYKEQLQALKDQLTVEKGIRAEREFELNEINEAKRARVEAAKAKAQAEIDAIKTTLTEEQRANIEQRNIAQALRDYELELISDRLRLGLIDEKEANKQRLNAEEDLIETLIQIGYNGDEIRGRVGTELLRATLDERRRLLETFVEETSEATDSAARAWLDDIIASMEATERRDNRMTQWFVENRARQAKAAEEASGAVEDAASGALDFLAGVLDDNVSASDAARQRIIDGIEDAYAYQTKSDREWLEEYKSIQAEATAAAEEEAARQKAIDDDLKNKRVRNANIILNTATSLFNSLNAARQADLAKEEEAIDAALAKKINSINRRVSDETEAERLITAATEQAEREKAQAQYDADLANHNNKVLSAIANSISAGIRAFSDYPWPVSGVIAGITAGLLIPELAALNKAKPTPPSFQTGGLVIGTGDAGTTATVAEGGSDELLFNSSASGQAFIQSFARALAPLINQGSGGNMQAVLQIGENEAARGILRIVQDGSNTGRVKINPRAVR